MVSISVTNWNGKKHCLLCLASIERLSYPKNLLDVMVVDNGSTDGSAEAIREAFPWVRVLQQKMNIGFAASVNVAVTKGKGKYTLLLANDEIVDRYCLRELVKVMEEDKKIALAGVKQYSFTDKKRIQFLWGDVDRKTMHIKRVGVGSIDKGQYQKKVVADYVCFTGLLRNSAVKRIGYIDERYFFSFEDLDAVLRFQRLGYKVVFVPEAKMWHMEGRSFGRDESYLYLLTRNNLLIRRKFNGLSLYENIENIRFLLSCFLLALYGERNKKKHHMAVAKAIVDFYLNRFGPAPL